MSAQYTPTSLSRYSTRNSFCVFTFSPLSVISQGALTEAEVAALQKDVDRELAEAEDFALNQSPYPDPSTLLEDVYAEWIEGKYGLEPYKPAV